MESFGDGSAIHDAEMLIMADNCLKALRIRDKASLKLNNLGDMKARESYSKALYSFYSGRRDELSECSRKRLENGSVLRILDSKDISDSAMTKESSFPKLSSFLDASSQKNFEDTLTTLQSLNINFSVDESLVRGLDYYNGMVFEYILDSREEKSQNAILAGGRYDGLVEKLGGMKGTPSIGWALGLERCSSLYNEDIIARSSLLMISYDNTAMYSLHTAERIRSKGLAVELIFLHKFPNNINSYYDAKRHCKYILIGAKQLQNSTLFIKNNPECQGEEISADSFINPLKN